MNEHSFQIGRLRCQVVSDGANPVPAALVLANVAPADLERSLRGRLDENGCILSPHNSVLIRTPDANVLIDAGLGEAARELGAPCGYLRSALERVGVMPSDIDVVIITHAHPDHIGGLTRGSARGREPVFDRARHWFWKGEWEYWTSEDALSQLPEMMAGPARLHLPVVWEAGLVQLAETEIEVVKGLKLLAAPGHTPGHMAVGAQSGDDTGVFLGDAVLHELNFQHPEWFGAVDSIPELAVETRERLLALAADEGAVIQAFHLPEPGHVKRADRGTFEFTALNLAATPGAHAPHQ